MTKTKVSPPSDDPAQMSLGDTDPTARARTGAPATSKAAAASLTLGNMRASQMRVLQLFTAYGDMDDRALLRVAKAEGVKMSDSGLRSRRSELAKPNMDRINELQEQWAQENHHIPFAQLGQLVQTAAFVWAQRTLRIEGFRSPLWDTGRRVEYEGGRQGIVWGKVPQER